MAKAHAPDNGSRSWNNRAGENARLRADVVWTDEDCKFVSKPEVTYQTTGGCTFSKFWAFGTILSEYTNDEGCECVLLKVTIGGVYRFIFSFSLDEYHLNYEVCADGSGTLRLL